MSVYFMEGARFCVVQAEQTTGKADNSRGSPGNERPRRGAYPRSPANAFRPTHSR